MCASQQKEQFGAYDYDGWAWPVSHVYVIEVWFCEVLCTIKYVSFKYVLKSVVL